MSAQTGDPAPSILWLGLLAAISILGLEVAYAIALLLGLSHVEAASDPIGDPYFTMMEVLIVAMMPAFVGLAAALYGACRPHKKPFALAAIAFVTVLAALTTSVHAAILFLSRDPRFAGLDHVFSFEWPSVVYVVDVLAWDFFFGFYAVCLALCFERRGFERWIRLLLILSGLLAFAGLIGAGFGDMRIRIIGILGYVGVFPIACGLIAGVMLGRLRHGGAMPHIQDDRA